MPKQVRELAAITEAAAAEAKKTGRMLVQHISPGWGSSGYYSTEVLEAAAKDEFIPAGTHMYADHPTKTEELERPVRSIKDLMAVTVEAGRVASEDDVTEWGADLGALVSMVDVVPSWQPLIEVAKDAIGVSIRGAATDIIEGEAEGRTGGIVEGLHAPATSVDFVTRAGRGGKVLQVFESARANQRAIGHGISEATVNDTREALQTALREAHATAKDTWLWVRDFDDSTVWFELEGSGAGDEAGIYGQAYTQTDDGAVELSGDRAEVRVVTKYVPVARPDSTTPTTEGDQEVTMGKIQIEEAEHNRLTETAGRVEALESENATLKAENTDLKETAALGDRRTRATEIVETRAKEAEVSYTTLEVKGFLSDLPVKEDGTLDEEAFTKAVDEDAAARKAAGGAGQVHGFGGTTRVNEGGGGPTLKQIDEALGLTTQEA